MKAISRISHGTAVAPRFRPSLRPAPAAALLLTALLALAGCGGRKGGPPPAVPVTAAAAEYRAMPLFLSAVGLVETIESVTVKAQVGGVITEVGFREGQEVRAGQMLIRIDPRPFQASLDAARAQLAKDKAQAANAEVQARRYADLVKKDYVTREQYDAVRTQAEMLQSSVKVSEAAVEQAMLNLGYTTVGAPISGRTGSLLVKRGNVVRANDSVIVVINQLRPIRVSFSIPGTQLPLVQKYSTEKTLAVRVRPSRQSDDGTLEGMLTFYENAVDTTTGTVTLKAEFANEQGRLWPGQFVDTELILTVEKLALTVPMAAVVNGQDGTFVYVIDAKKKVEKRDVRVNRVIEGTAVIDSGLRVGETVVTDGQMRLVPGAEVRVKSGLREPGRAS